MDEEIKENETEVLKELMKLRKNKKIIYKISRINQSSRFIDNNKSDKNE
jgi:hypothetical protein